MMKQVQRTVVGNRPVLVQYYQAEDRFFPGDRYPRALLRRFLGRERLYLSGMQRVVKNFLTGLERRGVEYRFNSLRVLDHNRPTISFGLGRKGLKRIGPATPLIAAIGFPYPKDFPELCDEYNVRMILQHSAWALDVHEKQGVYPPAVFRLWPAGVDTDYWCPMDTDKTIDVLLYLKLKSVNHVEQLAEPVTQYLKSKGLTTLQVVYGQYSPDEYRQKLSQARSLVFLSPHESQGFAYLEALACGVPVYAWQPGLWTDPDQARLGLSNVRTESVPFFDQRCGFVFEDIETFLSGFQNFWEGVNAGEFSTRDYVLENVSIEKSTEILLGYYDEL